jgi:shikimate dehydrogenase
VSTNRPTYAVIGDPVEHSLSPRLFAWMFAELSVDAHFTALRVRPSELPEAIARVRRGALAGLSVTLPHKEAVLGLLDDLHPLAARIGAANCVAREGGRLRGYNTDAEGFRAALQQAGQAISGSRAVVLGAGGGARAAVAALVLGGAKNLVIAARNGKRAAQLALELVESGRAWPAGDLARLWEAGFRAEPRPFRPQLPAPGDLGGPSGKSFLATAPLEPEALAQVLGHADLVVNATPVGLRAPDDDPLAGVPLHAGLTVLDMVYRPLDTALLRRTREAGGVAVDGLWMLVHQALEQLRIWTDRAAPEGSAARLHEHARSLS